jgi:hypothetical protein
MPVGVSLSQATSTHWSLDPRPFLDYLESGIGVIVKHGF